MESLGIAISNKFILLAVDKNYSFSFDDENGVFETNNARKIFKLSNTLAVSIVGLPHKITDLYSYILSLKRSEMTFDSLYADIVSVFNSNKDKFLAETLKAINLIHQFSTNGILDQDKLFKHCENQPELLLLIKETINMKNSKTTHTIISIIARENDKSVFGTYLIVGNYISGTKYEVNTQDQIYFVLQSSSNDNNTIKNIENDCLARINPFLVANWELDKKLESELYAQCKKELITGLKRLSPFSSEPNIIFYELNSDTEFTFKEPPDNLMNINFRRK